MGLRLIFLIFCEGNEIILAGGHFEACLGKTLEDLLQARTSKNPLMIRIPTKAVYTTHVSAAIIPAFEYQMSLRTYLGHGDNPFSSFYLREYLKQVDRKVMGRYNFQFLHRGREEAVTATNPARPTVTMVFE